ncbi:MAG: WbqC family protein [gamma proteobacterium symbiont of Taylorina sp.]|nr:WbqC family protein [gamma proteobacterium symbiont of Taylorina sp.]
MITAIHQPEFMPWAGFFQKMYLAEQFIILDHVQFKKRYFENRNKIVSPQGEVSYITVPVISKNKFTQAINAVKVDSQQQLWKQKILNKIKHYYSKSKYFNLYFSELEDLFESFNSNKLIDLNIAIINFFRHHLNISTPMIYSSSLSVEHFYASDLIFEICRKQSASIYLCGVSGRDYLNVGDFDNHSILVEWLEYKAPKYKQLSSTFFPYMSTLDLLFNHGDNSLNILLHQ